MAASLAVERQWLASWFKGTPVVIAQHDDGAVTVDVPREFCFQTGRSEIRPALAAVLDKVAESLGRVPLARVALLAAPDDLAGTGPLGQQRAAAVRAYLRSRGIPASALGKPSATAVAAVQIRMDAAGSGADAAR